MLLTSAAVRVARESLGPHVARLSFIAALPECFAQMRGDVRVLPECVGVREDRHGAAGVAALEAHPAEAIEDGRIVR